MWQDVELFHQAEVVRTKNKAEGAQARIKGEAKGEVARLQGKVEMYQFYAQVFGTRDYEPLKVTVYQRRKENEEGLRAQAMARDESGGKEGK